MSQAKKKTDDSYWAVGVNLNTGNIGPEISFDSWNFSDLIGPTKDRKANPSSTGKYMVLQGTADGEYQRTIAFDWLTGNHVYSSPLTGGIECPGGHGDFAIDVNGKDVFVGICKGGGTGPSAIYNGETVIMDFEAGTISPITGVGGYSHYSARNTKREGWVYASSYKTSNPNSKSRIVAFKTDGSRIEYYTDPQGYRLSYLHETHASPIADGTKIIFTSSWNSTEGLDFSNDYILDLSELIACPDSDADGICDPDDLCPGHDDTIDQDEDGIPDFCDDCLDHIIRNSNSNVTLDQHAVFTIQSNDIVGNGENVLFSAGEYVELTELFTVDLNAVFEIQIEACPQ